MMRSCRLRPALGLALLLSAAPAPCGTFTTGAATVSVNTTVSSNCTISATPITFGSYDPIGANSASGIALLARSEEHTSELQSQSNLVCRLLLEKKKNIKISIWIVNSISVVDYVV